MAADIAQVKPHAPTVLRCGWWCAVASLPVVIVIQTLFLQCLCMYGAAKMNVALAVDVAILARALAGILWQPHSRAWIVYVALGLGSTPLIVALAHLAGAH
jgi:hypothetical protein